MKQRILLMRHGELPQRRPRPFVGQLNLSLTDNGRAQARAAGQALAGVRIERVVCSDLDRTMETARLVVESGGFSELVIEPEPRLREIRLGQWEGLTSAEVEAKFPGEYNARGNNLAEVCPADGESFLDVQKRVVPCFEDIFAQTRGTTLIVAHSGVNRAIICHLLGLDLNHLFRFGQDYCCLNSIVSGRQGPCVEWINLQPWRELS